MNEYTLTRVIQTTITIEELGELAQALTKYVRYMSEDTTLRKGIVDIYDMIIEELADVELCLEKFKKMNYINQFEIDKMKVYKENRLNHM